MAVQTEITREIRHNMTQRFCILVHDQPYWHWDFLLENGDHALCWRLLRQPNFDEPIAAERLPPHRLLYLDFEGSLSNDRGFVRRIAAGTYEIVSADPDFVIQLIGLDWANRASLDAGSAQHSFWRFH